ncbi:MAG TPA: glycoside hydrolase family 36 protein, partial [Candidatus Sulfotelmatobacter sp.]|nr:glycoside hydrolase family 36 protein [Candidatus Sulfotelmatobacter sp.]
DTGSGQFSLTSKLTHRVFLKEGRLSAAGGTAKTTTVTDKTFGQGQAIEVTHTNGNRDVLMLFPQLPFALFRSALHNGISEATLTRGLQTLSAAVELGKPASDLKTLGTGGLLAPDKNPGSYMWLAVAEPQSRNGVVFGWLSTERGSGVLFSKADGDTARVEAQIDYGRLRLAPGATETLETLAVGYFEDARLGLETWAEAVAKVYGVHLPPQPVGYCTWYSQPHGGASDEKHLAEQSAFAAKHLAPFGFSVIQIDDKWQAGVSTNGPKRNFTTHNPDGPYPSGMKAAADNIKSLGLVPGIWFMPFAGTYYDPFFKDHPDWFVKHEDGQPYETAWGGTCLDMTHPQAREHLRNEVHRIAQDWGYQYFKMDGLWTGTGTKQQYVNSGYKNDNIGDAVFHNPNKSNIEAYRDGLKLVREAAGSNIFILGCCAPQNMRSYGGAFGLVDAMRIGPDNGTEWRSLLRGPTFGSRHYFLHGRIWYNDPDPVYVREKVPLNQAQLICSWVTLSGQLNLNSEWLPGLPAERLDLLKRTMPSHGLRPRPADLFEHELPSLWLLTDTRRSPRRDVVGIFNWESKEQTFEYALDRLGLNRDTEYVAFDYWQNTLMPCIQGRLQLSVPAQSCRILAVRPRANHPQLLSTSR